MTQIHPCLVKNDLLLLMMIIEISLQKINNVNIKKRPRKLCGQLKQMHCTGMFSETFFHAEVRIDFDLFLCFDENL